MAQDPAFLFYPGDYLRDTQCLSENSQVAYDRIMCEHMRNICEDVNKIAISESKLTFFTKRLNADEKEELLTVLKQNEFGFQIPWVAESICKRKVYSDSRRENRKKGSKDIKNTSKSYVSHMDNENENAIEDESVTINVIDKWNHVSKFEISTSIELPKAVLEHAERMQYDLTRKMNTQWIKNQWKIFLAERMLDPPMKLFNYQSLNDLTSYFINWIRNKKPINGTKLSAGPANGIDPTIINQTGFGDL